MAEGLNQGLDADAVIEDFLEGQPRANVWRELRESLAVRLRDTVKDHDALAPGDLARTPLARKIRDMRAQVNALAQEEAITQFTEDSVRASLARPAFPGDGSDDEESGY